jgi:hypothetical protein
VRQVTQSTVSISPVRPPWRDTTHSSALMGDYLGSLLPQPGLTVGEQEGPAESRAGLFPAVSGTEGGGGVSEGCEAGVYVYWGREGEGGLGEVVGMIWDILYG